MSYEEKITWVSGLVTLIVAGWYAWVLASMFGEVPVGEIAYQRPLLLAVGAMILFTIVGAIALAIGAAIRAEVTGRGSAEEVGRKDERDVSIEGRGDRAAFYASSSLMVGVLALAMLEQPYFWIANGVFAAFVVGSLISSGVKLTAYRRGF